MRSVVIVMTFLLSLLLGWSALADPLPKGFESHKFNASIKPVAKDGIVTFHVIPNDCSKVDYGDGRGESDCKNGNTKSIIRKLRDARLGETLDYRFDVLVDPGFAYPGYLQRDAVRFRPGGWDSQLRIASWEGPFIKNFIYMFKLDAKEGINFFARQCQAPQQFGQWVSISLKVHWANNDTGWVKATCDDKIIYADEGSSSTAQLQCYLANECQPGVTRDPKSFNFSLGLALNGFGQDWQKNGLKSPFSQIQPDGLTIKMRNISVTAGAVLYSPGEKAVIQKLQEKLNALGCPVGTPNGVSDKRTREAALSCRQFPDGPLPLKLTVATAQTFLDRYSSAGVADLPAGQVAKPPALVIDMVENDAEKIGHDPEAVSSFEGEVTGDGAPGHVGFLLIGGFDYAANTFEWLDFLLTDDLAAIPPALLQCEKQRTESWKDGSKHAVIQFVRSGDRFVAPGGQCIIAALPKKPAAQADFLLHHFAEFAQTLVSDSPDPSKHDGVKIFINRVAKGEISVGM
jgi:hypothetical protein